MRKLKPILVSLFILLSSCNTITVKNIDICTVAGKLSEGGICAETQTEATYDMTFEEYIKFLEPDVDTKKGPALCMSSSHFNDLKTALEQACKSLGSKCTMETQQLLQRVDLLLNRLGVPND